MPEAEELDSAKHAEDEEERHADPPLMMIGEESYQSFDRIRRVRTRFDDSPLEEQVQRGRYPYY
jgi:hypothetical protein